MDDIDFVVDSPSLKTLRMSGTDVQEISILKTCPNLTTLRLWEGEDIDFAFVGHSLLDEPAATSPIARSPHTAFGFYDLFMDTSAPSLDTAAVPRVLASHLALQSPLHGHLALDAHVE